MSGGPPIPCPGADELERAIVAGELPPALAEHVAACAACQGLERLIRENLEFMSGVAGDLGAGSTPAPRPILDPDCVPGYRLVREIARGGQGVVYEAVQIQTKRRVAVKMIEPGASGGRAQQRIEREAEIIAGLRHPNIVTVYHSTALAEGRYALAMEYVDGVTMDEWAHRVDTVTARTRESLREAVRIKIRAVATVCDAVQYAHHNGVIHRDLKPGNVLVSEGGIPRVVDFGIARRLEHERGLTRTGAFAGTLAYASPEQVSGVPDAVDARSDVYSLGLVLYEVLAGRRPYDTEGSLTGAIANITSAPPDPMRTVEPGAQPAGEELEAIVRKALAKDRTQRYQTANALKTELENWLEGRAVEARRESTFYAIRKTASRHRVAFAVGAGFLILLGAFAIAMAWSARKLDRQRTLLASSLSASTIERGRLLGTDGANARAEELIWPELLRAGADPDDPGLGFDSPPGATQGAWALFELYSHHPSLMHVPTLAGGGTVTFGAGSKTVCVTRSDGAMECRQVPYGEVVDRRPATFDAGGGKVGFDGARRRAVIYGGGTVEVVDLQTGRRRALSDPLLKNLWNADLGGDGTRLLTLGPDGVLRLWETEPVRQIRVLCENVTRETRVCVTDDGLHSVAGIADTVRLWRNGDGEPVGSWKAPPELWSQAGRPTISVVQLSADQQRLVVGMHTWLLVFAVQSAGGPPVWTAAHRAFVNFAGFSADSSVLLSSGNDRNYRTWNPATGELLETFEQSVACPHAPSISGDGSLAGVCDAEQRLRVWETRPRGWLTGLRGLDSTVHCVRFSPDGGLVGAVGADGSIRVWRTADRGLVWTAGTGGSGLSALSFSPDGAELAGAGQDGVVRVWDARSGGISRALARGPERVTWVGYSPDGRTLAVTGGDTAVHLYAGASGEEIGLLSGHTARVVEAAFSPDGSVLASAGADGVCILWDVASGKEKLRLEGHTAAVRATCFSPDGTQVATGSDDWTIRLWDVGSGRCVRTLRDVKQHVFGLAFHPKGNLLFSCCRDSVVQVWDARTGVGLAALDGHHDIVYSLAISPDGRTLATASGDRTVGLWDLAYYQTHVRGNAGEWKNAPGAATDPP